MNIKVNPVSACTKGPNLKQEGDRWGEADTLCPILSLKTISMNGMTPKL